MAYSYYIYYRISPEFSTEGETAVGEILASIESVTGIRGRLLRKTGEPLLWMEVYENIGDRTQFEAALSAAAARPEFSRCLQPGSARRIECFSP